MSSIRFDALVGISGPRVESAARVREIHPIEPVASIRPGATAPHVSAGDRVSVSEIAAKLSELHRAAGSPSRGDPSGAKDPKAVNGADISKHRDAPDDVQPIAEDRKALPSPPAPADAPVGMAGTVVIQLASGAIRSVAVSPNDRLADVAAKINGTGMPIAAEVVSNGEGGKLRLRGTESAPSDALTVREAGVSLGLSRVAGATGPDGLKRVVAEPDANVKAHEPTRDADKSRGRGVERPGATPAGGPLKKSVGDTSASSGTEPASMEAKARHRQLIADLAHAFGVHHASPGDHASSVDRGSPDGVSAVAKK